MATWKYVQSGQRWHKVSVRADGHAHPFSRLCNLDEESVGTLHDTLGPGLRCQWCKPEVVTPAPADPTKSVRQAAARRQPTNAQTGLAIATGVLALVALSVVAPVLVPVEGSPSPTGLPLLTASFGETPSLEPSPSGAAPSASVVVPSLTPAPFPSPEPTVPVTPAPTVAPTPRPTQPPQPEPTCAHPGEHRGSDNCPRGRN